MNMFWRKPRVLKDIAVSEISAVDKAAAPGAQILMRKRNDDRVLKAKFDEATARLARSVKSILDDDSVTDKNKMLGRTFGQALDHLNKLVGSRTSLADVAKMHAVFEKNLDVSIPPASPSDGMPDRRRRRRRDDEAARLASQMDTDDHDSGDDDDENEQKEKSMIRSLELSAIAKKYGVIAIAKSVNEKGAFLSEGEFTGLVLEHCKRVGRSFEQVYCDSGADGIELRKAATRCRDEAFAKAGQGQLMPIMPTQVSGQAARDVNADKEGDAYEQLVAMAEKMRAASPEMTLAQAFERTYTSAEAKELAELERRQARSRLPTTGARTAG